MWARLRGVLARVGRWFLSPAGRAVWVRLLLFGASIPLAPYMWPCGGSPRTGRGRSSVSCSSPWRACSCSGAAGVACMRCAPPATRTGSPARNRARRR